MRLLHHFPLCPFSRIVRMVLKEKSLDFELKPENYWQRNFSLIKLNPAVEVPVLIDDKNVICDINSIFEYLEESYPDKSFLGEGPVENAEIRRIAGWYSNKFYHEVSKYIINEKVIRYYKRDGTPNSEFIRAARENILSHLDYINFLLQKRDWLAGNKLTYADIAAACQLSVLDYLGDVPWHHSKSVKNWYALIKSRPSFRPFLEDRIVGFNPSAHYLDLDF
jgi:glutathione S-transferase